MKRLVTLVLVTGAVISATSIFAQGRDLAGSWVVDPEKTTDKYAPQSIVLTLTAKEFTAQAGGEKAPVMTFKLDGTETELKLDGGKSGAKAKAAWKGDKLEVMLLRGERSETLTFSREGTWLVVEVQSPEHGKIKNYFKKASLRP